MQEFWLEELGHLLPRTLVSSCSGRVNWNRFFFGGGGAKLLRC